MSVNLMLVVLFAAVLHASWNAILKAGSEKFLDTALVTTGAAFVAAFPLLLGPLPPRRAGRTWERRSQFTSFISPSSRLPFEPAT